MLLCGSGGVEENKVRLEAEQVFWPAMTLWPYLEDSCPIGGGGESLAWDCAGSCVPWVPQMCYYD